MNLLYQLIPDIYIEALGWMVIHSLWQGVAIAILLFGIRKAFPNLSSRFHYGAALSALVVFLIGVTVTFLYMLPPTTLETILVSSDQALIMEALQKEPVVSGGGFSLEAFIQKHIFLLTTLWLAGVLVFSARLCFTLLSAYRLKNYGLQPVTPRWNQKVNELRKSMSIRYEVSIWESCKVIVPATIGFIKPVILIPVGTINRLSPEDVEAVIAHELAHISRYDYLINLLQSVVEVLFYYHPAIWWISSVIRTEREKCCDDLAMQTCTDPVTYAKALLRVSQQARYGAQVVLAANGNKQSSLSERIQRILYQPQQNSNFMEKMSGLLVLLACLVALGLTGVTQAGDSSKVKQDDPIMMGWKQYGQSNNLVGISDTIPPASKQNEVSRIVEVRDNGDRVEFEMVNGEVSKLVINGEKIPESSYGEYEELIRSYREKSMQQPVPPRPPQPPAPPSPQSLPEAPDLPEPPQIDEENGMSVSPSPERRKSMYSVRKRPGQEEKHVIVIEKENADDQYELEIDGDDKVIIKGKGLTKGDTIIVIDMDNKDFFSFGQGMNFELQPEYLAKFELMEKELARKFENKENKERLIEELRRQHEMQKQNMSEYFRNLEELKSKEDYTEREREILENYLNNKSFFGQGTVKERIHSQLLTDGMIQPGDSFEFELTGKYVKVNGDKKEDEVFEKYREIYEKATGLTLTKKTRIKLIED